MRTTQPANAGVGRRRHWAGAQGASVLETGQRAANAMMAYSHLRQLLSVEGTGSGLRSAMTGETVGAGPGRDPMKDPVQTPRTSRSLARHEQRSRAQAVRAYIQVHLHDPDLGVDQLCRRFAMSRRTLYRMFADDGGVARYVTERRLARAFDALRAASPSRGLIKAVALTLGFADQQQFRRLFRKRYAMAPSDAVGLGSAVRDPAPEGNGPLGGDAQQPHSTDRTSQVRSGRGRPA